ncbi:late competence protein ComER [Salinibacillus xinjiangensis]|uniref:Late competence protein ComER n=1 Tax=Salinibacillus xinjiangensis TaxID=1229268 RepID=A0A6G1X706_9BACI|nr:late competence protein ComER [Salinibacillus xinjiangensis]MRG86660.1 late competence protein ComER [Salinibacillus xinjiangensis]
MKWGVIGTGNMGSVLIDAWLTSGVVAEDDLWIHNRTLAKAFDIKDHYPSINVCTTPERVVKNADIIFVCVKPLQVIPFLNQINKHLRPEQCIVSITSPISVQELDQVVPCQTARIIPSITNRATAGATLLTFSDRIEETMKAYLIQSCKLFSIPVEIDEAVTRVSSDIVSCGPAFLSYLIQAFIRASKDYGLDEENGTLFAEKMIVGFGKLIEEGHYSLKSLQEKVTVKGGVTGAGLKVFDDELGDLFYHLLQATHDKYGEDRHHVANQLSK